MIKTRLEQAREYGRVVHAGQLDDLGRDYYKAHCEQVQAILALLGCSEDVQIAGLLHDTIEDTGLTYRTLSEVVGGRIADIVFMCTHEGKKDQYGYYFPRLVPNDWETLDPIFRDAVMVKFADRLSNLSRMEAWDDSRIAQYLMRSVFWKTKRVKGSKP